MAHPPTHPHYPFVGSINSLAQFSGSISSLAQLIRWLNSLAQLIRWLNSVTQFVGAIRWLNHANDVQARQYAVCVCFLRSVSTAVFPDLTIADRLATE